MAEDRKYRVVGKDNGRHVIEYEDGGERVHMTDKEFAEFKGEKWQEPEPDMGGSEKTDKNDPAIQAAASAEQAKPEEPAVKTEANADGEEADKAKEEK